VCLAGSRVGRVVEFRAVEANCEVVVAVSSGAAAAKASYTCAAAERMNIAGAAASLPFERPSPDPPDNAAPARRRCARAPHLVGREPLQHALHDGGGCGGGQLAAGRQLLFFV